MDQSNLPNAQRLTPNASFVRPRFLTPRRSALLLLLLTLIGGAIRFTKLDQPTIWYDEAATFARTAGTYRQMLSALEDAGFGPLHYCAYWWIKNGLPYWGHLGTVDNLDLNNVDGPRRPQSITETREVRDFIPSKFLIPGGVTMTPFFMRLIPAICGTLMIPAMYWLTRELLGRRHLALLAATLTTFSAYLLNYSRDAKMYSDLWLFVALNVAALLWWLRTRRLVAWTMWIVTATAMIGTQLQGLFVIGIELLIVLTARNANWRYLHILIFTPLWAIVEMVQLGTRTVVRFIRRKHLSEVGKDRWVQTFDWPIVPLVLILIASLVAVKKYGWIGGLIVLGIAALYFVTDWLFVILNQQSDPPAAAASERTKSGGNRAFPLDRFRNFRMPAIAGFILGLALIAIGPATYFVAFNQYSDRIKEVGWSASGLQWVPEYNFGRTGDDLVEYTFSAFLTGWEWPRDDLYRVQLKDHRELYARVKELADTRVEITPVLIDEKSDGGWWGGRRQRRDPPTPAEASTADAPFIVPADQILLKNSRVNDIGQIDARTYRAHVTGTLALGAVLLMGAFPWRWPWRKGAAIEYPPLRFRAPLWIAAWIVLPMYGLYCYSTSLNATPVHWMNKLVEIWRMNWEIKIGVASAALLIIMLCDLSWPRRLLRVWQVTLAAAVVLALCTAIRYASSTIQMTEHGSAWIPRYLGVCLPAVFIAAACLIARLPTRLLRSIAIGLFIVVNAGQFLERVVASEPPVNLMVADALAGNRDRAVERIFYAVPRGGGTPGPGTAALFSGPSRYYYEISRGNQQISPQRIRGSGNGPGGSGIDRALLGRDTIVTSVKEIADDVAHAPVTLRRFMVWDRLNIGRVDTTDKIADAIGADWRKESEQIFTARDHWTWRDLFVYRRRVYFKVNPLANMVIPSAE